MSHRELAELEADLDHIRQSPSEVGHVALIVCRPAVDQRQVLDEARLDAVGGLVGDNWRQRCEEYRPGEPAYLDTQVTLMNARAIASIAATRDRWPLAGDQFYVDFDLSAGNLPTGSRIRLGEAVLEVSAEPHLGCSKFAERYGRAAVRFVNCQLGKELRLRGVNARVIEAGAVRIGDRVEKLPEAAAPR